MFPFFLLSCFPLLVLCDLINYSISSFQTTIKSIEFLSFLFFPFFPSKKPQFLISMASTSNQSNRSTSSSEEEIVDERKRKRMISNRESARRSRQRKQQHLDELVNKAALLKEENARITMQTNMIMERFLRLDSDNAVLRAQLAELTGRLQSVNSVLRMVEEFSGVDMDIQEIQIPDPLMRPWQMCSAQPIACIFE